MRDAHLYYDAERDVELFSGDPREARTSERNFSCSRGWLDVQDKRKFNDSNEEKFEVKQKFRTNFPQFKPWPVKN